MICRVCLLNCEFPLQIFDKGISNIAKILQQHFYSIFKVIPNDHISTVICSDCWYKVDDFHQFYSTVEEAHHKLQEKHDLSDKVVGIIKEEDGVVQAGSETMEMLEMEVDIKPEFVENVLQETLSSEAELEMCVNPLCEENPTLDKVNNGPQQWYTRNDEAIKSIKLNDDKEDDNDGLEYPSTGKRTRKKRSQRKTTISSEEKRTKAKSQKEKTIVLKNDAAHDNDEIIEKKSTPVDDEDENSNNDMDSDVSDLPNQSTTNRTRQAKKTKLPQKTISASVLVKKFKGQRLKEITPRDDEIISKHIRMQCDMCGEITKDFGGMRQHFRDDHDSLKPYVMCCGRKLSKRFILVQHAYKHEDPEFFKCTECHKVFADNYILSSHMRAAHAPEEELTFACDQCEKRFARRYLLEMHKPSHIPVDERQFQCDQCPSKPFASNHLLQIHMSMRHKKATNVCHVCAKEIRDNQAFEKHVRLHFEDSGPRVKCPRPNCDRWLKDEDNLKQHLRRHNDEGQIFTCTDCAKICKNRRALASHIKYAHTNEVFECDECHKTFKKAITLKEHMAQHTGESLYKCPFCTRTFNSNANMHSHKKKMHPIEWDNWRKTKRGSSQQIINSKTILDSITDGYDNDILMGSNDSGGLI